MPHPEQPSYEELAARNAELTARVAELLAVVAEQAALIETLRTEVAALRLEAGRDSLNSSQPPSQDSPAAEAKARAGRLWVRAGRPQGGQKGHPGAGLQMVARPDETGSSAGLLRQVLAWRRRADRLQGAGVRYPAGLTVTEYQMMRRTCGCGQVTTAPAPPGISGGPACYGPNVADAATLLASTDVIGIERAADLMGALLKAPVSTGFVSRCLARLDAALIAAGFEDALKDALRAADVTPHRRDPCAADRGGHQRGRLRQPARLHGADHARLYRRRAGPHLVRRRREPEEALDRRFWDPGRLRLR